MKTANGTPVDTGEILHAPELLPNGRWVVRAEDTVLGVTETRDFETHRRAQDFHTLLLQAKNEKLEQAGDEQHRKTSVDAGRPLTDLAVTQMDGRSRSRTGKMAMRTVAETLAGYGLDPAVEISGILMPRMEIDPDGVERQKYALDDRERAKALLELMQYVHPKLKAVEITKLPDEMTEEQVDRKLEALFAKAQKRGEVTP